MLPSSKSGAIGTVSSEEKAELAKANGCAHTVNYKKEKIPERVRELTDGQGVPVVYDSAGGATSGTRPYDVHTRITVCTEETM